MKTIVIYFSQTGNTKKMAHAIHEGMSELSEQCDIARIQDVTTDDLAHYDLIGLGAPVWHRQEPANVLKFIEFTMRSVEGKHAFAFCTHGLLPGRFLARVVPIMTQRGLIVIGWKNWYASVCMPEKPKPYFTDGHPDEIDLDEAQAFGREMVERSKKIRDGDNQLIPALPRGEEYDELYHGTQTLPRSAGNLEKWLNLRDFDLKINKEKCNYPQCTICIDNCPMDSINMKLEQPVVRKNCDRCWFCEQICPRGAIEVDWEPIAEYMDKYIIQSFSKVSELAEAKGFFRRLVPLKDVGWNTYWYSVKKHPRLKLP